jgi:parallel beta-helix repeat protein
VRTVFRKGARGRWLMPTTLAAALAALLVLSADQALASHVDCGEIITEDTTLDSDLVDCPGDGIRIGADNLTLDLNGHTIDGDGGSPGAGGCDHGIENGEYCFPAPKGGYDGVTIKGGAVRQFDSGIHAAAVNRNLVRELEVSENELAGIVLHDAKNSAIESNVAFAKPGGSGFADGIVLSGQSRSVDPEPDHNRIEKNLIFGNGGRGMWVEATEGNRIERNSAFANGGTGIRVDGAEANLVAKNQVTGNGGHGIDVSDGVFDNRVFKNRVSENDGSGIVVADGAHGNRVERNWVSNNAAAIFFAGGIYFGGDRGTVENNYVSGNGSDGIVVSDDDNRIEKNYASRNAGDGLTLSAGASDNTIEKNHASGNTGDGIGLEFSALDYLASENNRIKKNSASGNGGDGISVSSSSTGTLIRQNRTNRNSDDGIDVDSVDSTLTKNRAIRNGDLGIEAVPGVRDGGGNRAKGNGDPAQCTGVGCK